MAGEQLPLGIRFTARDVETANITSEVQKAINTAIANTDTKQLSKKFENAPITITTKLSKQAKGVIAKDVQSALNKVGIVFTDRNVKTKTLIEKVRRGVSNAISTVGTKTFGSRLYDAAVKVRNGINVALNSAKFSDLSKRLQQQLSKPVTVRVGKVESTKDAVIKLKGKIDGKTLGESVRALDGKYSVLIRAKVQGLREAVAQIQRQVGTTPTATGSAKQAQSAAKANQELAQSRRQATNAAISHTQATSKEANAQSINTKSARSQADALKQLRNDILPAEKGTKKLSSATVQLSNTQNKSAAAAKLMFQPFNKTRAMTDSLAKSFQEAGINAEILGTRIAQIAKRFSGFFIYTAALFKFLEAIRETTQAIKDLDRTAASLGKVLKELSEDDIDAVNQQLIEMAINTKRAYSEAATAMENFARQGLSTKDAMQATKGVLDLLNISTVDAATASKLIITTFNAFGGEMEEMTKTLATFSDLADASAIDVVDLAQGFIRSAAAADAFGVSQEQLASAIATVGGVTQMQATRIGTAFKTIFSYLGQNRKAVLELAASYRGINRTIGDLDNEFSTMHDTLRFVAEGWASFSKEQRSAIGQLVGGKRRFNELSALMQNFSKYQELYGQSLEESNAIQRKSEVESKTLAAAHRELSSSIVQLSKSFTDFGATDFYKNIISGLSSIIQLSSTALRSLDTISNFIAEASDETIAVGIDGKEIKIEINNAQKAFLGFVESATSGSNLLTNSFIYLFARVVLPFIGKATKSFKAFLTGNEKGLNKILAQQAGYTQEVANSISALSNEQQRLTGILQTEKQILQTRQQSSQVQAGGTTAKSVATQRGSEGAANFAAASKFVDSIKNTQGVVVGMSAAIKNAEAVSRGYGKALTNNTKVVSSNINSMKLLEYRRKALLSEVDRTSNIFQKLYVAVKNGLQIQKVENRAGIAAPKQGLAYTLPIFGKGLGDSFKKSLGGFKTSIGNIRKQMSGFGGQMIKMVAIMQGIQAIGGGFESLAEGFREDGDALKANAAELGASVAQSAAPLAAFGPAAALAGVAMGAFKHTVSEVSKALKANAALVNAEAKVRLENLNASELLAAAQDNYLLQTSLVERGLGEFVKNARTGAKEFNIISEEFGKLDGANIRVEETRGVATIKEDLNEVIRQATILSTKWNDNLETIEKMSDVIDIFKSSAEDITNAKIDLNIENTRELLGYASSDMGDLLKQINKVNSTDVKFLAVGGELGKFIDINREAGDVIDKLNSQFKKLQIGEITRSEFSDFYEMLNITTPEIEKYNKEIEAMEKRQVELQKSIKKIPDALGGADFSLTEEVSSYKDISNAQKDLTDEHKARVKEIQKLVDVTKESTNLSEEINKYEEKRKDLIEKTKKEQLENLLALKNIIAETEKRVQLANHNLKIQLAENALLGRNDNLIRQINGGLAENGTEISEGLSATIATRKELEKSAISIAKLTAARERQVKLLQENAGEIAVDFGAVDAITQQIDVEIKGRLRDQIANMIGTLGDKAAQETERISKLEKERFNIAKEQLEKLAEMERYRIEIAGEMTSSLIDSAKEMGASDIDISSLIDSSAITEQFAGINENIKDKLNNQAKVQLAHSLEQINIEEQKQKAILDAQMARANDEQRVALETKRAIIEKNFAEERSVEIMDALKKSSIDALQTIKGAAEEMRSSLDKMKNIRADILKQDKEIATLQAKIKYDEQIKGLQNYKSSLEDSLSTLSSFSNRVQAVERKNNALVDSLISSEKYLEDVADEVGGLKDLSSTLGITGARADVAKRSIGGIASTFANMPRKLGLFEDKIQELRINSAKETVNTLKEEYNKLKTYGEQLYAADYSKLYEMAAAQSAIENATGDLNEKLQKVPLFLRGAAAEYVKRQYGEEGGQAVAKAGLERVGLDSTKMESLEKQTVDAAKEAVKAQFRMVELQQNSINAASVHAEKIQSKISSVDEKITAVEETKNSVGNANQTLKEQLNDAKERKKLLQKQIEQEIKLYSQNAQRIDKLLPGVDSMTQGISQQTDTMERIHNVLMGQNTAVELQKAMQPFQQLIAEIATQTTGGETVSDPNALANQLNALTVAPLNDAIGQHKKSVVEATGYINQLREIYNNENLNAQQMIEKTNAVIAKADAILTQEIAAATDEQVVTLKDEEIFKNFSNALVDGIALSQDTKEGQKKNMTEAVKTGNEEIKKNTENNIKQLESLNITNKDIVAKTIAVAKTVVDGFNTNVKTLSNGFNHVANAFADIVVKVQRVVTGNKAHGLTGSEERGLLAAARREKRKMPQGAGLTVANTSELVMTPKQANKVFGQVQMPEGVRDVQKQMYTTKRKEIIREKTDGTSKDITKLTNKINDLLDRAEKKELFKNQQEISINVDGKREISLKGVKSFKKELKDTFKQQMSGLSSKAELNAVRGTLEKLIRRLRETGVDGV